MFLKIAATANGRIFAVLGKIVSFSVLADLIALNRGGALDKQNKFRMETIEEILFTYCPMNTSSPDTKPSIHSKSYRLAGMSIR